MSPRVTVIVPVFNSGPGLDDLVTSLVRQTLPAGDLEVLLCDDGSDAQTQARLDVYEAEHPQVTVLRLPHSGWPGTPRNVGIDRARGRYLFFSDHDDHLGHEALQRLCDFADANSSDVVTGKVVGLGRGVPRGMFARTIPDARLGVDPVLDLLTPHKLFRTEFLREHGIRFPDGRVRLEDHMLVMQAYFAADVISIYSDYPCYYWVERQDRPSASMGLIDPETYFPHLETVLDIVEANTEPGPLRDALLERWYRGKVLKRLGGTYLQAYPEGYLERLVAVVEPIVERYFGPGVDEHLTMPMRLRSALLRAGRIDDLATLGEFETAITASAEAVAVGWDEQRRLVIDVCATVRTPDGGAPVVPPDLAPDVLTAQLQDTSGDPAATGLEVFLRDASDTAVYLQASTAMAPGRTPGPGRSPDPGDDAGVLNARTVIDPRSARAGRPVTKRSELVVGISYRGWRFSRLLRIRPELLAELDRERVIGRRTISFDVVKKTRLVLNARKLPSAPAVDNTKAGVPLPPSVKRWARRWVPLPARRVGVRVIRGVLRRVRS